MSLIIVLDLRHALIITKQLQPLLVAPRPTEAHGIIVGAKHAVHGGTVLHSRVDLARQSPLAFKFELEGTSLISLDGGSAQSCAEPFDRWKLEPRRQPRALRKGWVRGGGNLDQFRLRR